MRKTGTITNFALILSYGLICSMIGKNLWAQAGTTTPSQGQPRVYITDSTSWEVSSAAGGSDSAFGASGSGGARPQTAEIIKTFGQRCPQITINNRKDASDYIVQLDHEGGKSVLSHRNKVAVFVRRSGDSIFSNSTLSVGSSVQDACAAITKHWNVHAEELRSSEPASTATNQDPVSLASPAVPSKAMVSISSNPSGADIAIDGNFIGNTPSSVEMDPGMHTITISKKDYQAWSRKVKIVNGTVTLNADLESSAK